MLLLTLGVAAVVVNAVAVSVAVAYWRTQRRWFDPVGYSCNLFQFVWTAKLVSQRVHALQSTAYNAWYFPLLDFPSLLGSFALLNQQTYPIPSPSLLLLKLAPSWLSLLLLLLLLLLLPLVLAHTNYSCLSLATAPTTTTCVAAGQFGLVEIINKFTCCGAKIVVESNPVQKDSPLWQFIAN